MKRMLFAVALFLFPAGAAGAQQDFSKVEIVSTDLGNGFYMLEGAGGNLGVFTGDDGVFLIDDQYAPLSEKILAAIAKFSDKPVTYVINTHFHGDHTGGNENLGMKGAIIVAHDNVRKRLSVSEFSKIFNAQRPASPPGALPVITFNDTLTFHLNGQTTAIRHVDGAHTDGDALIHFPQANIIHTGDIFFNGFYPFIDVESGGNLDGMIEAIDQVIELANGDTQIIPGHGPLATKADAVKFRTMLDTVRVRLQGLVDEGASLEDVTQADPLADLNQTWGGGFMDGPAFTRIAYYSVSGKLPE